MADYKADDISNSYKMVLLMEVIDSSLKLGDKLLVFSQSLLTLDLVERFLQMRDLPPRPGLNYTDKWVKNRTYFREYLSLAERYSEPLALWHINFWGRLVTVFIPFV